MNRTKMGFRQIHLDFHTSPAIPDVASQFDARRFARLAKAAHVDSITVFAKCHHGHLYFNTRHPARHPGLPRGFDLLRRQVDALHAEGIRAPIYISVLFDEFAARNHPDWVAVKPDGGRWDAEPFGAGWHFLDMSSPYRQYLTEQILEIVETFRPADGVFFDICGDIPSASRYAKEAMTALGLDPQSERDRNAFAHRLGLDYMREFHAIVKRSSPGATVHFNSRPLTFLPEDVAYLTHVEVEALPTGGWGYMYFPTNVRYVRKFARPYVGMTARFHKSWGDFGGLKPEAALRHEVCQMIAHGARCSIGDQMHPRGTLDAPAWEAIGRVYAYVEQCQPWCEDAVSAADTALVRPAGGGTYHVPAGGAWDGATRLLMHLKQQFDVVDPGDDLGRYRLLILPDEIAVSAAFARALDRFVARGGAVLATGASGLDAAGRPVWKALPIRGPAEPSPFTVAYLEPARGLRGELPAMPCALYEKGWRVRAAAGAEVLATVTEPYFERSWRHFCSHAQTPPAKPTRFAAAAIKGRVAYIAYPIFRLFGTHGHLPYRSLVAACLRRLAGRPMVEIAAPATTEVSVMRKGRATVVHVLYAAPDHRNGLDIVEDFVPLRDVALSVALPRRPTRALLAPSREPLPLAWAEGRAEVTIPRVDGHQMMVFE